MEVAAAAVAVKKGIGREETCYVFFKKGPGSEREAMKNANLTSSNNGSSPWELRSSRRGNGMKGGEGMLA